MRYVKAFGAAVVLAALISAGIMLYLPGVSEFIAVIVGAVAGVAVWSAVMHHGKAKVEQEGTASLHYTLIGDRLRQGLAYLDTGQFQRAIAFFNRAIESEPDNADAYFGRGLVYHELEQYQQAIADFDRAIEIDSEHPYAHFQRGFVYHQLEQDLQAIADFTRAIEIRPDVWAYRLRSAAYNKLGQHERAQADLDRAGQLSPALEPEGGSE